MHDEVELLIEQILARKEAADAGSGWPGRGPDCPDSILLMARALDQTPPDKAREVDEHCAGCEGCRTLLAEYRTYFRDDVDIPEPPPGRSLLEIAADRREFVRKPRPEPTPSESALPEAVAETAPLGPGYTQKALRGDAPGLTADLRPWVPFLLQRLGVSPVEAERLAGVLLSYVVSRIGEVTPQRRFRDLLPGWLADFAAAQGLTLTLPPLTTEEWESLLKEVSAQEAIIWVLSQDTPGEPENLRDFRRRLLDLRPQTPQFLREYRSEEEANGDRAIARFRRDLAAQGEQRQQDRYVALELAA